MTYILRTWLFSSGIAALLLAATAACTPTVKVETPDKPITINLNVNISHEIRVKVDKDLENAIDENSGIF